MMLDRLTLRVYLLGVTQMVLTLLISMALYRVLVPSPRVATFQGPVHLARFFVSSVVLHRDDPARMKDDAERIRELLGVSMSIYGARGTLLVASHAPPLPPLSERERARLAREEEEVPRGDRHVIAIPLVEGNAASGYALVEVPPSRSSGVPRGPQRLFFHLQSLGFALGLLSLLVLSVLFGRALARPLSRLTTVSQAFGRGDLSVRAGLRRRDAFGVLGAAFDQMADHIALLLRSQKEILGNVSHELRTPLSRIRVALDIAAEGNSEDLRRSLAEISADLEELEQLLDDVLTAVRLDLSAGRVRGVAPPLHKDWLQPERLLERAAGRFRAAHPGRQLAVEVQADLPAVEVDPTLLRRAIENLLDNARKYSEPHTVICLRAARQGARLLIEVVDQGIGIDAADLPLLTTPFFRTDRSRARRTGGIGLGLVLVRQIVAAHGGDLLIDSRVGAGTSARIYLPLPGPCRAAAAELAA